MLGVIFIPKMGVLSNLWVFFRREDMGKFPSVGSELHPKDGCSFEFVGVLSKRRCGKISLSVGGDTKSPHTNTRFSKMRFFKEFPQVMRHWVGSASCVHRHPISSKRGISTQHGSSFIAPWALLSMLGCFYLRVGRSI